MFKKYVFMLQLSHAVMYR